MKGPILSWVHLFQWRWLFHIFSQDWSVNLGRPLNHWRGTLPLIASLRRACSLVTFIIYSLLNFLGLASVPNTLPGNDEIATASCKQYNTRCYLDDRIYNIPYGHLCNILTIVYRLLSTHRGEAFSRKAASIDKKHSKRTWAPRKYTLKNSSEAWGTLGGPWKGLPKNSLAMKSRSQVFDTRFDNARWRMDLFRPLFHKYFIVAIVSNRSTL